MKQRSGVDEATSRRIAVEADADPRSVKRELMQPGSVRGMSGHRIREVLERRGLRPKPSAEPVSK